MSVICRKEPVIISGKEIAAAIREEVRSRSEECIAAGCPVTLAILMVGEDSANSSYFNSQKKACEAVGIRALAIHLPENATQEQVLKTLEDLNHDAAVSRIIVEMPLPGHIDQAAVVRAIDPGKDIDGLNPVNIGQIFVGQPGRIPCTPAAVMEMLHRYHIETEGKECVIVGRGTTVGKALSVLMLAANATVTVAHSRTRDLPAVTRRADILISAVGKPGFITKEYVKEGAVVIDCGICRDAGGKLCGDVDFENVAPITAAISPVPGGVGPVTVAKLLQGCVAEEKDVRLK